MNHDYGGKACVLAASIQLSELGRLTGRFNFGFSTPLLAMNLYFDGSTGGDADQWMTLAGIVATDRVWSSVERQWESMLFGRYPIAPYVHMAKLLTGNDPFERIVGWTGCKVTALVNDAIAVIDSMPKDELFAAVCSINVTARKRLLAEGYTIPDPALLCAKFAFGMLYDCWLEKVGSVERIYLFYDRSEPFIKPIKRRWLECEEEIERTGVVSEPFWGLVANVQDVSMRNTPGVQAADVLAWSVTRRLLDRPGDKWALLADNLLGSKWIRGVLTSRQYPPMTESVLREMYRSAR